MDIGRRVPMTHEIVMNRLRHRRFTGEVAALVVLLSVVAVLAGCASPAATHPASASSARSPAPAASTPAAPGMFTSRHYGYTEALPAGWGSTTPATQQWNGKGAPGDEDSAADLFQGPAASRHGR